MAAHSYGGRRAVPVFGDSRRIRRL